MLTKKEGTFQTALKEQFLKFKHIYTRAAHFDHLSGVLWAHKQTREPKEEKLSKNSNKPSILEKGGEDAEIIKGEKKKLHR